MASRLPFSPRNQRAIAESVADWRHESRSVPSAFAVVRALSLVMLDEIAGTARSSWVLRLAGWTAAFCIAEWMANGPMPGVPGDVRFRTDLVQMLPLAAFFCVASAPRKLASPVVAFGLLVVGVCAPFATGLLPVLAVLAKITGATGMYVDWRQSLALVLIGVSLLVLAERVRMHHRRTLLLVMVPPTIFAGTMALGWALAVVERQDLSIWWAMRYWRQFIPVVVATAMWTMLSRRQKHAAA